MATPRTICIKPVYRHLSKGLAAVVLCLVGVAPNSVQALASDAERLDEMPATGGVASGSPKQQSEIELASFTDQQIGSLLQQWPRLDATQRRDLLAEVRKRMRAAGDSANTPLVS